MGSAGRAIGPDGKPLKQQQKNNTNKNGGGPRNGGGRNQNRPNPINRPMRPTPGMPFATPGMPGPRPLMGGPVMGPRPVPGGPGNMPMQPFPMRMPFRSSVPDPTGSYGFFAGGNPQMTDGGNGNTPAAPVAAAPIVPKLAAPTNFANQNGPPAAEAPAVPASAAAPAGAAQGQGAHVVGEVPGFGTNSSIHELFGKMVWRKMEGLRDQAVIDRLQNRIMNLIHDALSDQSAAPAAGGAPNGMNGGFRPF